PRPPTQSAPWLELHRLPPLEQAASLTLFTTVVGSSSPPAAFRDWAVHVAAGNPFFVRALASHWVETGELRAPISLEALVAARVERLTGRPLRTLQACAVLGKQATLGRVESVLEYPRHELIEATASLEDAGFLAADGAAIPCRHDLIARAALAQLQDGVRRLLHRSAGEVLEREVRDARSAALLWDCAQQWKLAGESARALALVRSTAAHLLEVGLPAEAADAYERAIELCETDVERVEMFDGASRALVAAGIWRRVIDVTSMIASLGERSPEIPAQSAGAAKLLQIEARWRCAEPLDELLRDTYEVLSSRTQTPRIRLRAGLLGLAISDNVCDEAAFQAHYDHARPLYTGPGAEASVVEQIELIYHTCRGDLHIAVPIARELAKRFREAGREYELAKALRFAAYP
ncbi:MAG TPA: hypothetical protein VFX31_13905, partial [Ktedonobacterales bacterium]|nr:hypothetical protein [Ktedonobacterales bacterium]